MPCLTDVDVQAVVDGEATADVRAHVDECDICHARVDNRRADIARLVAAANPTGGMPPSVETRLRQTISAGQPVRGATRLRDGAASAGWRRAGWISAAATAATVALIVFGVLPRFGSPTSLSAAQ